MSGRFLTYIGTALITASCMFLAGGMTYNTYLGYSYEKAVEESTVYIPKEEPEATFKAESVSISGSVPVSIHEDYMLSYSNVLYIPAVNIKAKVFDGMDKASLSKGVGRDVSTMKIGEYGNCVIAGHSSTMYDCIFNGLESLGIGDSVTAYAEDGTAYLYRIKYKYVVKPTDTSILRTTDDSIRQITLYTCIDGGENRLVLVGEVE